MAVALGMVIVQQVVPVLTTVQVEALEIPRQVVMQEQILAAVVVVVPIIIVIIMVAMAVRVL